MKVNVRTIGAPLWSWQASFFKASGHGLPDTFKIRQVLLVAAGNVQGIAISQGHTNLTMSFPSGISSVVTFRGEPKLKARNWVLLRLRFVSMNFGNTMFICHRRGNSSKNSPEEERNRKQIPLQIAEFNGTSSDYVLTIAILKSHIFAGHEIITRENYD